MNNTTKIIIAISAGAIAGVAVGILLAPEKGTETIKNINRQGKKIAGNMKHTYNKVVATVHDVKDEVQKAVKDKVDELV